MGFFRRIFEVFGAPRRLTIEDRVAAYLTRFPHDEPAAYSILVSVKRFRIKSARQVAEKTAGRPLSNAEWEKYGARWQRAWDAIVGTNAE